MRRRSILPALATAATVAAALLVPSQATAAPAANSAQLAISSRTVGKPVQQVRAFWTPERLRQAAQNSADLTALRPGAGPDAGQETSRAREGALLTASAAAVPPTNFTGSQSHPSSSTMAVSVSQRVPNVTAWPTTAAGRLFFSNQAGDKWYTCSAVAIVSNTSNAVWTAGHCLHDGSGGDAGWHANFVFIPSYSLNSNPYGWWYGVSGLAPTSWINGGDHNNSDMAALIVVPETGTATLQGTVGAWGYKFDGTADYSSVRSYGYAAQGYNRPDSDFNDGEYMMYCDGPTVDAANLNPLDNRLKMACDMGGGASGGPMMIGGSSNPQIVGNNSHRLADQNGNYIDNWMYSSNHGGTAVNLINAVNNS